MDSIAAVQRWWSCIQEEEEIKSNKMLWNVLVYVPLPRIKEKNLFFRFYRAKKCYWICSFVAVFCLLSPRTILLPFPVICLSVTFLELLSWSKQARKKNRSIHIKEKGIRNEQMELMEAVTQNNTKIVKNLCHHQMQCSSIRFFGNQMERAFFSINEVDQQFN